MKRTRPIADYENLSLQLLEIDHFCLISQVKEDQGLLVSFSTFVSDLFQPIETLECQ